MPESIQHKLDRVRRPRVQITYDVETLGSIVKTELPFVVGIMADLSGNSIKGATPKADQPSLKDRKFVEIDRDNFDTIMEKIEPKVKVEADELTFRTLEDFSPINVLRNVRALREKFESRTRLSNLVAKLDGDVELQKQFVASYRQLDDAAKKALSTYYDAVNPLAKAEARTPSVTNAIAKPGETNKSGLVITRNEADSTEVTHFKITDISGGKLFKNSGEDKDKITAAAPFITVAEGEAGLKFTRDAVAAGGTATPGTFKVQASVKAADEGLNGDVVTATITNLSAPTVTVSAASTNQGERNKNVVIAPNAADAAVVTHFKISNIKDGDLFKNDGESKIENGQFITKDEGAAGLKFKPTGATDGSFKIQASISGTKDGLDGDPVTAQITNAGGGQ
jgi:type VI secretion system protein ImpB